MLRQFSIVHFVHIPGSHQYLQHRLIHTPYCVTMSIYLKITGHVDLDMLHMFAV